MGLIAFHGKEEIKKTYLDRVIEHARLDEIRKGTYFEDGEAGERKMGAVGCTIHSDNHSAYETELGIPEWLAKVEDRIFEGLTNDRAMKWPLEFLSAINIGADLEQVKSPFMIFVLESVLGKFDHEKYPDVLKSVERVISLYKTKGSPDDFQAAADAAAAARAAAAYADAYTAAAAARAAAYAAYAAANARAADAYAAAAHAAVYAADVAAGDYAASAPDDAYAAAYIKFADKLLELLREY